MKMECRYCKSALDKISLNMYKAKIKPISLYRCYKCKKDYEIAKVQHENIIIKEININCLL